MHPLLKDMYKFANVRIYKFTNSSRHRDVAQSGSATVWGTGGRKFESCHPDEESARALFCIYTFRIIKRSRTTKLHQKRLQRYDFFAIYTIVTDSFAVFLSHLYASLHPSFQERRGVEATFDYERQRRCGCNSENILRCGCL